MGRNLNLEKFLVFPMWSPVFWKVLRKESAIILSEPKKTFGSNDISQGLASTILLTLSKLINFNVLVDREGLCSIKPFEISCAVFFFYD